VGSDSKKKKCNSCKTKLTTNDVREDLPLARAHKTGGRHTALRRIGPKNSSASCHFPPKPNLIHRRHENSGNIFPLF